MKSRSGSARTRGFSTRGSELDRFEKNIGEVHRKAPGLPQSEIARNENHYHNNTNYVENIVHVSFSFLSRDLPLSQMPVTLLRERAGERLRLLSYRPCFLRPDKF
jgi:hypothetical protein